MVLIKNPRTLARRLMRNTGDGPLPLLALRVQKRAREEVREFLSEGGFHEHRLYVLEVAGSHPHIKIGYSSNPWVRLTQHIGEMNRWYHTLIRVHVSEPLSDQHSGRRAEDRAHGFMRRLYPAAAPSSRETFRGTDFKAGAACVDVAVSLTNYPA
ncbi:hypothetical protein OG230_19685 [Streptomyces sp. NBC_00234]|uniref:hypothetical protein n=1 Tax=Streptomyces sp. NBC_00234 TaxID=2903638 RepID=UPI002E293D67|nr:hypothetical protein [Streptomyces sp. NBC_00234]